MILAVDIGNSNIVLGGVREKEILFQARIVTDHIKTSDQYCAELKTMLDLFGVSAQEIEGSIVASVVPPVLNSFRTAIRKLTGKSCLVVGPGLKTGLNILIDNPAQTGADLVAGAVAALREYQPPLIVVDMGTATTISGPGPERQPHRRLRLSRRQNLPGGPHQPDCSAAGYQPGSA
ncbi:MAG: type III pantothenate kinase [Oscillospiraceae bacterium]